MIENVFDIDPQASEAELRDQIEHFERVKSAAAAAQARAAVIWDRKRREAEAAAGVSAARRGKGLSAEIALARREAPNAGGRHLGFARALVEEMPHTLAALEGGALSEWRATLIVRESACLSPELRRQLDAELSADPSRFDGWGDSRVAAEAKKIACRLDIGAVLDRSAQAEKDRRVTLRPAPDAMTKLTVLLPMKQGVAVYASLNQAANTTFDDRSRGQVMADTVFERVTGRPADAPVPVNLNLVMADTTLFGDDDLPAWVQEYGPVAAEVARRMVVDATLDEKARAAVRRLYRHPKSGQLVAMESKSRLFPKGLATFIGLRDQTCRTPYCNAPVRHRDHAVPHREGGPTSVTNGLGLCEACNYTKEADDWTVTTTLTPDGDHVAEYITPTGAVYRSTAPPLPGPPSDRERERDPRLAEEGFTITRLTFDAA
ncbi:HNH endonuclease [Mycolicibacterium smegmatis]|uniref:HNH endonuclease n=1 Tax=Mycolicibacterium smegmatis TaxID=1772 RepID=UPI001EFB303C|nr:HNH endonuclease signature motif containing protein [Mycolicibacterium smegmatis]MCP2621447.1 HNH endonuclease [Mycolicibacterium smegmatis]ULN32751.1 HNH endonuclease [Mycolicibacterium smegmatis]